MMNMNFCIKSIAWPLRQSFCRTPSGLTRNLDQSSYSSSRLEQCKACLPKRYVLFSSQGTAKPFSLKRRGRLRTEGAPRICAASRHVIAQCKNVVCNQRGSTGCNASNQIMRPSKLQSTPLELKPQQTEDPPLRVRTSSTSAKCPT